MPGANRVDGGKPAIQHPYRAAGWRSRTALARAGLGLLLALALLPAVTVLLVQSSTPAAGETPGGTLCGGLLLAGLAAWGIWLALLSLSNALVTTADLALDAAGLTVWLAGRWPVRVEAAPAEPTPVVYRLGQRQRIRGPLIRPRRRMQQAVFVPLAGVSGWRFLFRAVGRMYAGWGGPPGLIITPDHMNHEGLLERLRQAP